MKEGIVFANRNRRRDSISSQYIGADEKYQITAPVDYAIDKLKTPENQRIRIGIQRLSREIALIENSWQRVSIHHTLEELENILNRQHEIEKDAGYIEDIFLRKYIYRQLDAIAAARRSLVEKAGREVYPEKMNSHD